MALVLKRKPGESLLIGPVNNGAMIEIIFQRMDGHSAALVCIAPEEITIARKESPDHVPKRLHQRPPRPD